MNLTLVHSDKRGKIYVLELSEGKELKVLKTNKGYARGACQHTEEEQCLVIDGIIDSDIAGKKDFYMAGQTFKIPANAPHYIKSITNSIIMEWGASLKGTTKDSEMLKIVEEINEK